MFNGKSLNLQKSLVSKDFFCIFALLKDINIRKLKTMKKLIFALLLALVTFTSCISYAYAQDEVYVDNDEAQITVVVRYGTPYYLDGMLLYYLYDGWYYYPYYHNNFWYYYRYQRPLPYDVIRHGFIPPHGHRPFYHGNVRPRFHERGFGSKHRYDNARPNVRNRPNRGAVSPQNGRSGRNVGFGNQRPTERKITPNTRRSSTYQTAPRTISPSIGRSGGFGGARSVSPSPSISRPSAPAPRSSAPSGGSRGGFGGRR